ncbi:hypothetical protein EWB00_001636 [Schistosoma japonicum]|uniref:Uncharacterized protein n=1 Tax=Schistosoma japonicum TaxID=6182 RepID=A0A4Z2CKM3_SCHJA|nr:hypothetical protein EWB00_001636 [Schistosoma japonicum]
MGGGRFPGCLASRTRKDRGQLPVPQASVAWQILEGCHLRYQKGYVSGCANIPGVLRTLLVRKDQWTLRARHRASGETGGQPEPAPPAVCLLTSDLHRDLKPSFLEEQSPVPH